MTKPKCPPNCGHTIKEHVAFGRGVASGELGEGDGVNPYQEPELKEAWLSGYSVGTLNRLDEYTRDRGPKHHALKCWPDAFNAIGERRKLFEVRIDDRDFREGDSCELREWNPDTKAYTYRWIFCKIGYVLKEPFKFPGVKPGFCVWSIILPANHHWPIP